MSLFEDTGLTEEKKSEIIFSLTQIPEEVIIALKAYNSEPEYFLSPPDFRIEELKSHVLRFLDNGLDCYMKDPVFYFFLFNLEKRMKKLSVRKAQDEREKN